MYLDTTTAKKILHDLAVGSIKILSKSGGLEDCLQNDVQSRIFDAEQNYCSGSVHITIVKSV